MPSLHRGQRGNAVKRLLTRVLGFTATGGKILKTGVVADPARLRELNLAGLGQPKHAGKEIA